jgi:hypothetical protein
VDPAFTWIRDTAISPWMRTAAPTPAFRSFSPTSSLAPQAQFNRIDVSNSSYYGFDKEKFVLARNTRYGQVRAFGSGVERADSPPRAPLSPAAPPRCAAFPSMARDRAIPRPAFPSAAPAL